MTLGNTDENHLLERVQEKRQVGLQGIVTTSQAVVRTEVGVTWSPELVTYASFCDPETSLSIKTKRTLESAWIRMQNTEPPAIRQ